MWLFCLLDPFIPTQIKFLATPLVNILCECMKVDWFKRSTDQSPPTGSTEWKHIARSCFDNTGKNGYRTEPRCLLCSLLISWTTRCRVKGQTIAIELDCPAVDVRWRWWSWGSLAACWCRSPGSVTAAGRLLWTAAGPVSCSQGSCSDAGQGARQGCRPAAASAAAARGSVAAVPCSDCWASGAPEIIVSKQSQVIL